MSAAAHDAGSSESSSGYEDGLGRRVLSTDRESGEMRERLVLRPELKAFARSLQERLPIVAGLEDERFARPRLVVPEPGGPLSVLSDFVPGRRLCDILDVAGEHGIVAGIDAGLGLLLELLPALSRLHDAGITHGALGPGRIMVTTDGQVVVVDALYGEALERLQFTRKRLWTELRLAFPSTAGAPRFDKAADLTQAALTTAALIVGRPLRVDEYPEGLPALRQEILEIASIRASKAFADGIDQFFAAALPLPTRKTALASADEAAIDIRKLLRKEVGIATCRTAMIDFFQQVDGAERERAGMSTVELAALEAQRAEVERFEAEARAKAREDVERQLRDETERQAREDDERRAREEAERKAREEAERRERERLEAEQRAREDEERRAREEAERKAREEAERRERERLETERRAREEEERRAREEAERKAREEAERRERERLEAERLAREEEERRAREEAERRERERLEAERRAREEEERRAREEAERKAREEAERRERERLEAERRAREEEERRAREEAERKAREEAERKAREAERRAREEEERRAREEAERKAREEAERKAREEAERRERERLEAERRAREEEERRAREEAERKAREEAERRAREEAERKAREEAERRERERLEAERRAREEEERRARAEAERKAREEAERIERERAEQEARERIERARLEAERVERERIEFERRERERAEQETRERIERARLEAERVERERIEAERAEREQAERDRIESARVEAERRERERLDQERRERNRTNFDERERERERLEQEARERLRLEQEARDREEQERAAAAAAAAAYEQPSSDSWLVPPDRAAAFEPAVVEPPPPAPTTVSAYPIYTPPAETQSWTPEFEAPPTIEIAPVAGTSHTPIRLQGAATPIRLKDEPAQHGTGPGRSASRHEPVQLSAEGAYEPFHVREEQRQVPWKLIAAGLVLIAGTFAATKGLLPSEVPMPRLGKPVPQTQRPVTVPATQSTTATGGTTGRIAVTTDPSGVRVMLDGKVVGVSPLTIDKVTPGKHTITMQGAGGLLKRSIRVDAGETIAVDIPVFSGFLEISSPIVVDVAEDGKSLGTSEGQIILGPGRHLLHVQNRDLNYNAAQTVDVEAGGTVRLRLDPRGTANFNAVPWAEVYVDGEKVGDTPLANVAIRLGVREIVFKNPAFAERKFVTTVKGGVPLTQVVDFNKDKQEP